MERTLEELRRCLRADELSIIGLHGTTGTGKTTILKKLERETSPAVADYFSLVIFATMPTSGSMMEALQVQIGKCLGLPADELTDQKSLSETILKQLEKETFLLIVDDIWQEFDMGSAGIPLFSHKKDGSKLILSSRYHNLCGKMGAQRLVRMETLTTEEAWLLFQERVGVEAIRSDPKIAQLARTVAGYCHDLPLALVLVGAAMAGNKSAEQWKLAVHALQSQPSVSSGLTEKAYRLFKFCCSYLSDARTSKCLLYCSMFPKGHSIRQDALINLWMAKGFMSGYRSSSEARAEGRRIITFMKDSGLLESCPDEQPYVILRHQIHDMATRLLRETDRDVIFSGPRKRQERSSSESVGAGGVGKLKFLGGMRASSQESCEARVVDSLPMLQSLELARSPNPIEPLAVPVSVFPATIPFAVPHSWCLVGYRDDEIWNPSTDLRMGKCKENYFGCDDEKKDGNWVLKGHGGDDERDAGNRALKARGGDDEREVGNRALKARGGDDEREVGNWALRGRGGDDEKAGDWELIGHGGDDEREVGNWALKGRGGDDEREVGNWALKGRGGDDEREVGNWALKGRAGDDEKTAGDWELIGHGGDDEREVGNWALIGHGGDDEREVGNWALIGHGGDDEREVGNWALQGHGGDDEREVGNWSWNLTECAFICCRVYAEREVGIWGMIGHGGDGEKAGNLRLIGHGGDNEIEVGSWRLVGRGGDDEREVGISRLVYLRSITLSNIRSFQSLPTSIAWLINLRFIILDLDNTVSSFQSLPTSIASLINLRSIALKCMSLKSLPASITSLTGLHSLDISNCPGLTSSHMQSGLSKLRNLRCLRIDSCRALEELVICGESTALHSLKNFRLSNLPIRKIDISCASHVGIRSLAISSCPNLKNAAFIQHLEHLEQISISDCDQMDHLVGEKDERVVVDFHRLKRLTLVRLPRLEAISWHKLTFPSLEYLHVDHCYRLREVQFGKQSAKHPKEIGGPIESWNALEQEYEIIDSSALQNRI